MKYIVFNEVGFEEIIIFPDTRKHKYIAKVLGIKPVSAGSIKIDSSTCHCSGYSESLHVKSREEVDDKVLKRFTSGVFG